MTKAEVYILDAVYAMDKKYSYYLPSGLEGMLETGGFVVVPFGKGNLHKIALVASLSEAESIAGLKPVISLSSRDCFIGAEGVALCEEIAGQTFSTVGDIVRQIIPSAAFDKLTGVGGSKTERGSVGKKENVYYARPASDISDIKLTDKQRAAYDFISEQTDESAPETSGVTAAECARAKITRAVLTALCSRGAVNFYSREVLRSRYAGILETDENPPKTDFILNDGQKAACAKLNELLFAPEPRAALLSGITGSGKTRVIIELCKSALAAGKGAIVLVPEIALTWQSVSLFAAEFGGNLAVIHSALAEGERFDAWKRISRGDAKIVLGTRSAVFAPVKNCGIIAIDEEQEHTYKSDMTPRYHARDVAKRRIAKSGGLLLLCSATPSVESYHKADIGAYTLVRLENRCNGAPLPPVVFADMRGAPLTDGAPSIGKVLREEIGVNLERGEQTVLFLNRRGYHNYVSCMDCGGAVTCPHCSVALTLHMKRGEKRLVCHYCGYGMAVPQTCPSCGGLHLKFSGTGTEHIEKELGWLFPSARLLRMDADTTARSGSADKIVESFRKGEADILIGTQMVTKGHNFPRVTLSGIINADSSLYLDDYAANERTFSLITQVIGRSGRADKSGRAVIQTMNPEHKVLRLAAAQNYEAFFREEIAYRRALVFPPFCDIARIVLTGENEAALGEAARLLAEKIRRETKGSKTMPMTVFGPFEAPIYKMGDKFRLRIIIKHKNNAYSRGLFSEIVRESGRGAGKINVAVDINPSTL